MNREDILAELTRCRVDLRAASIELARSKAEPAYRRVAVVTKETTAPPKVKAATA